MAAENAGNHGVHQNSIPSLTFFYNSKISYKITFQTSAQQMSYAQIHTLHRLTDIYQRAHYLLLPEEPIFSFRPWSMCFESCHFPPLPLYLCSSAPHAPPTTHTHKAQLSDVVPVPHQGNGTEVTLLYGRQTSRGHHYPWQHQICSK